MFTDIVKQIKTAFLLLIFISLLMGIIYPFAVTAVAQLLFHWKANGSLIEVNGKVIGSSLIGQAFTDDKYFNSRPSATTPFPYNAANSGGSNLGPSNPDLLTQVSNRVLELKKHNPDAVGAIPIDLVTTSASGVDPDISTAAAYYQSPRIAKARGVDKQIIDDLIKQSIHMQLIFFGAAHVNVLELNLALDKLTHQKEQ